MLGREGYSEMNKGSIWKKWDLHIHTPESFSHEFKFSSTQDSKRHHNNIWEKYISKLEEIQDISVVGITDYFTIEGYKKVLEYRKNGRLQNFDLILPNIEFRLDKFVDRTRLNYHVILSDEVDVDIIEREFLQELHVQTPTGEDRTLTRENIEYIGKHLKKHEKSFGDRPDYFIGCMNITVSLDEIVEIFEDKKSIFGGKYLLVLVEPDWALIDWKGQDHLTRKNILWKSDAVFSSNENTRDWSLGKKHDSPESFIDEFGSLKPCIHGSDAHCFEKLCKPQVDRFCWIKADPTFEGLKQIVYEPEDRVRISPENPEYAKNIYTLDSVRIDESVINDDLTIGELDMKLNSNLVTVIGGKGAGKTAFLDLTANCFEDRCYRCEENVKDKNSFVQRIEEQRPDLMVELRFIGEDVQGFSKQLVEKNFFKDVKITYLPQGKIEEYSGNREQLDKKIQEIIFTNKEIVDYNFKQRFDEISSEVDSLVEEIDGINMEISSLEEETAEKVMTEIDDEKHLKEGELNNYEAGLKRLRETIEESAEKRISELKAKETELREKHSKLIAVQTKLEELKKELQLFQQDLGTRIFDLNSDLSELLGDLSVPLLDFKLQLDAIDKALSIAASREADVYQEIEKIERELGQLEGVEKEQAELIKSIADTTKEIKTLKRRIESLLKKRGAIKALEDKRLRRYIDMLNKHLEWRQYYKEVIDTFSRGKSKIMSGVDFEASIHFDKEDFEFTGCEILDLRRFSREETRELAELLQKAITEDVQEKLAETTKLYIERILKVKQFVKGRRTHYDFYKWVFSNYFTLSTSIFFNKTPMDKLSIGQKGTVLLKLFLAEGDYPLIVDQPEENLDNRYIYDELVEAFKEAKTKRQVIVATNNANLVVNTDTEQIIIAEFKNNVISYRTGALEDLGIRKEVTTILEGGKEAFRKREKKYGMSA